VERSDILNDLSKGKKLDIIVELGLKSLPGVGGPLASIYYSFKEERRFQRLESFYQELSVRLTEIESQLLDVEAHDKESLIALIERLNEEVERESSYEKRVYLKNFFVNLLRNPTSKQNYDERQMLLDTLATITFFEFQVLLTFSEEHKENAAFYPNIDPSLRLGAISRLEMLGLLNSTFIAETYVGSSPVEKYNSISGFGVKFINFCLA